MENKKHISWDTIQSACMSIANQLKGLKFDVVISLGRGGMIPARLVSEYMNIHDVRVIPCYSYDGVNKQGELTIKDNAINFSDLEEKSVLLIDDVYTTGKTVNSLKKLFFDKVSTITITTATVYFNIQSLKKHQKELNKLNGDELNKAIRVVTGLDVYGNMYLASQDWLVFPWELE